ncbi:hypothetical protein Hanom_Chr17g01573841 [Helianthus anomalus]
MMSLCRVDLYVLVVDEHINMTRACSSRRSMFVGREARYFRQKENSKGHRSCSTKGADRNRVQEPCQSGLECSLPLFQIRLCFHSHRRPFRCLFLLLGGQFIEFERLVGLILTAAIFIV